MVINGYKIDGKKSEYIDILVNHNNFDRKELENKTFKQVVLDYCFYYQPLVLIGE
jgi:hypothetical protein